MVDELRITFPVHCVGLEFLDSGSGLVLHSCMNTNFIMIVWIEK